MRLTELLRQEATPPCEDIIRCPKYDLCKTGLACKAFFDYVRAGGYDPRHKGYRLTEAVNPDRATYEDVMAYNGGTRTGRPPKVVYVRPKDKVGRQKCVRCNRWTPRYRFAVNPKTKEKYATCTPCREIKRDWKGYKAKLRERKRASATVVSASPA